MPVQAFISAWQGWYDVFNAKIGEQDTSADGGLALFSPLYCCCWASRDPSVPAMTAPIAIVGLAAMMDRTNQVEDIGYAATGLALTAPTGFGSTTPVFQKWSSVMVPVTVAGSLRRVWRGLPLRWRPLAGRARVCAETEVVGSHRSTYLKKHFWRPLWLGGL